MSLLSAKFKFISIIIDAPNSWSVVADIIDNYGIYYANDVTIGDLVYCENSTKYTVTDISLTNGARFIGKLTWYSENSIQSPTLDLTAVIGAINNGEFITPNQAAQGIHIDFTNSVVYLATFIESFNVAEFTTTYSFKQNTLRVYLNGIRLNILDDYTIDNNIIYINDFELEDTIVVDYERL